MNNQDIKNQLKQHLPKGYVREIQRRLSVSGIEKSIGHISQVCNPTKTTFDIEVINAALTLAKEEKSRLQATKELAGQL